MSYRKRFDFGTTTYRRTPQDYVACLQESKSSPCEIPRDSYNTNALQSFLVKHKWVVKWQTSSLIVHYQQAQSQRYELADIIFVFSKVYNFL